VLNDGTVAFMHWEYQERDLYNLHNVWRCHPDGTHMDAYYKQHINLPSPWIPADQNPSFYNRVVTIIEPEKTEGM
jgi:hypothetical protein